MAVTPTADTLIVALDFEGTLFLSLIAPLYTNGSNIRCSLYRTVSSGRYTARIV